jgi:hypothetical protein
MKMNKGVLALAMAGSIASAVVGLGSPAVAQASVLDDAAQACRGYQVSEDWQVSAQCRGLLDAWKDTFAVVMSAGASYAEECIVEGCSNEEIREMHRMYKEEMINESGGSYHEMMEIAVGVWQSQLNDRGEAVMILGMLAEFDTRGWVVRTKDRQAAQDKSF